MKLIKILIKWKIIFQKFLPHEILPKTIFTLSILCLVSLAIWFFVPYLPPQYTLFLKEDEKRLYIILILFLLAFLKFLLLDLAKLNSVKNPKLRKKLAELSARFQGALTFLQKTQITKSHKMIKLAQLPWFLLLGPSQGGKTSLLSNCKVNFILQKQIETQKTHLPSENFDWWVTREMTIVDVPGKFTCSFEPATQNQKATVFPFLWRYFLSLLKKYRGTNGLSGLILAVPLREILQQDDPTSYQIFLRQLLQRLLELQQSFPKTLPCFIVITKCDLMPGFNEFFSELSEEELQQAWGVNLNNNNNKPLLERFYHYFDALIKKLNQQVIWRLHHERNPQAKPYIKDFPLQVERLKNDIGDLLKKLLKSNFNLQIQGVYLTSSLQTSNPTPAPHEINISSHAVQVFKDPVSLTRSYFLRQLFSQGFIPQEIHLPKKKAVSYTKHFAYLTSVILIGLAALYLGKDFQIGVKQAYSIQRHLDEYQLAISKSNDLTLHLHRVIQLLNELHQPVASQLENKISFASIKNFYSNKSQQQSLVAYQQALKLFLLPILKDHFQQFLQNNKIKSAETVYSVLAATLSLSNQQVFQAEFVLNNLQQVLPQTLRPELAQNLLKHLQNCSQILEPQTMPASVIENSRHQLLSLTSLQLSYTILACYGDNNETSTFLFPHMQNYSALMPTEKANENVKRMFTAQAFAKIFAAQASIAAKETTTGNWILGASNKQNDMSESLLTEQLQLHYLQQYIQTWENIASNYKLKEIQSLTALNQVILELISDRSPLLQLLVTIHANTYFEPIVTSSAKLKNLSILLDKNHAAHQILYQILSSLEKLQTYLAPIAAATDQRKAAFNVVAARMQTHDEEDPISQLRITAEKSPEPIKSWLNTIANQSWRLLMQDAASYIDISWQEQVIPTYQTDIANHYPFAQKNAREVELKKFAEFFGKPGVILNFYDAYLRHFIDASDASWRWKSKDSLQLPFKEETLHKIQLALQIHDIFFPEDNNKPFVQFALKPYQLSKNIQSVRFNINDKQLIDSHEEPLQTTLVPWPSSNKTLIELKSEDAKISKLNFSGDWGWFKLMNQSFESALTTNEMLLNIAHDQNTLATGAQAKYLLFTNKKFNPFLAMDMRQFNLPNQLG